MIAIDTNVLLRYLLDDDVKQSKKASAVFAGFDSILITDVVLVETIWILMGRKYKLNKESIITVINSLFEEPNVVFEDAQTVWRALCDYARSKSVKAGGKYKQADFADALILNKARYVADDSNNDLVSLYTFDTAFLELSGTTRP